MGDGSLSQDEIDALLQGADDITSGPESGRDLDISRFKGRFFFLFGGAGQPEEPC